MLFTMTNIHFFLQLKRPAEAKDAKEVAKKLLKTGAIKAIQKSLNKEKNKEEKTVGTFKRSMGFERKLNGNALFMIINLALFDAYQEG